MVIFFNVQAVRNYLLVGGTVYTLRTRRRNGNDVAVMGTLYNYTVFADVVVQEVGKITNPTQLEPYVGQSGIRDANEWFNLAKELHGQDAELWLYKVKLLRRRVGA